MNLVLLNYSKRALTLICWKTSDITFDNNSHKHILLNDGHFCSIKLHPVVNKVQKEKQAQFCLKRARPWWETKTVVTKCKSVLEKMYWCFSLLKSHWKVALWDQLFCSSAPLINCWWIFTVSNGNLTKLAFQFHKGIILAAVFQAGVLI